MYEVPIAKIRRELELKCANLGVPNNAIVDHTNAEDDEKEAEADESLAEPIVSGEAVEHIADMRGQGET